LVLEDTELALTYAPAIPLNFEGLDIPWPLVVDLVARRLNLDGVTSLSALQRDLKLPHSVVEAVFRHFQKEKVVEIRGTAGHDYMLGLTSIGHRFAADRVRVCHYAGPAPVSLRSYQQAVRSQAARPKVNRRILNRVFTDLVVEDDILQKLGPALISQKPLFLFGPTGNGKTSLAERIVRIYEDLVVIPYAVEVDGQIIVIYDPVVHQKVDIDFPGLDPRWAVCRRPEVMVGGELMPEMLELRLDHATNIYAAPAQMKANNGILVVDDFGRQLISPSSLLNRWIIPLDRRIDYLSLSYGLKFQIPFELMIVFATNLLPKSLMDPAFLRRIPNKIFIHPVSAASFREIFQREASRHHFEADPAVIEYSLELCLRHGDSKHLRACYPRDICDIVTSINSYEERPHQLTGEDVQRAVDLYFAENEEAASESD
jgi:hypothetical protein